MQLEEDELSAMSLRSVFGYDDKHSAADDIRRLVECCREQKAEVARLREQIADARDSEGAARNMVRLLEGSVANIREVVRERDAELAALTVERDNLRGTLNWVRERVGAVEGQSTENAVSKLIDRSQVSSASFFTTCRD